MKFCRSCGSALAGAPPSSVPVAATLMADTPAAVQQIIQAARGQQPAPMGMPPPGPMGGMPQAGPMGGMPQSGPIGMPPPGPMGGMPPPGPMGGMPQAGPMGGPARAGAFAPAGAFPPPNNLGPGYQSPPPTMPPDGNSRAPALAKSGPVGAQPAPGTVNCPRCGTATPSSFAFCQHCGLHLQAMQPTQASDPKGAPPRAQSASQPQPAIARAPTGGGPGIDVQATLAADGARASGGQRSQPAPQAGPAWGTAILVNRDGSDGQRFPLAGEYLVVGRTGADIEFAEDRFLARQHARLERGNDGSVKVLPIDALNGVFRKADAPVDLLDGTTILVGREVLRFERVDGEESKVQPLVRHGVALFGSPPREPWGRLMMIIPSGGYRDVRHLTDKEIVLGREEGDIVFRDDAFMSRRHAAITWDGKKAQVTDLGSSNGTFVRLVGPTAIKHGDHVRMGDQLLRIELGR